MTGQLQILAANDDDLCAAQDLLGDDGRETAEQVTATVNDDSLKLSNENKINKNGFKVMWTPNNPDFNLTSQLLFDLCLTIVICIDEKLYQNENYIFLPPFHIKYSSTFLSLNFVFAKIYFHNYSM